MKFVWFDWGSTLAHSHTRKLFMCCPWISDDILFPGVRNMLSKLRDMGIHIGLVSNMRYHVKDMDNALRNSGLLQYFDFTIYNTSDNVSCKKPCSDIFQKAYHASLRIVPDLKPSDIVMVGNSFAKDIIGFLKTYPQGRVIHVRDGNRIANDVLRFFYMNNIYDVARSDNSVSFDFDGSSISFKDDKSTSSR